MKSKLFLLTLLLCISSYAQSAYLKVDYDFYVNFSSTKQYDASLYIETNKLLFVYKMNKQRAIKNDENDFHISLLGKDTLSNYVITDFKKDSLYSRVRWFEDKVYQLQEKKEKIQWTILNITKKIGDYDCQKAIGNFRGRKYIAWFTTSFPVSASPWKLQGLPGLVLKVSDSEGKIEFIFKSIEKIGNKKMLKLPNEKFERISIKQYAKMQRNYRDEVKKRIMSKMPRGMKVEIGKNTGALEIFTEN
ncbi:GLPGLI family protein [Kordia sp.]|uniref:GLPGLI family protein n=1 Tax=Kordia sp. TaxID=1965332 RepID=UPI003D2DE441